MQIFELTKKKVNLHPKSMKISAFEPLICSCHIPIHEDKCCSVLPTLDIYIYIFSSSIESLPKIIKVDIYIYNIYI